MLGCDDCDDLFAWAERDQFAYYLTLAYMSVDPDDWPAFRRALHGAVLAALYLDRELRQGGRINGTSHQLGVRRLLDDIRGRYNPAVNWAGFVLELWERRQELPTVPPS